MALDIKHIWWDVEETLFKAPPEYKNKKIQRRLELYSEITQKPINEDLKNDYQKLFKEHKSHSKVLNHLGRAKIFGKVN